MKAPLALLFAGALACACGPRPASDEPTAELEPVDGVVPIPAQPESPPPAEPPAAPSGEPAEAASLPAMNQEDCEKVGTVVGDPGDGRTRRPDFVCPNGKKPVGTVASGIEGSACCPN